MSFNVLHIIDSGGFYGAEAVLVELVREQRKQGINAQVCSIGLPGEPEKALERHLRLNGIPFWPERMNAGLNFKAALGVIRKARAAGINLIHSHGYKANILFGFLPKVLRKIPVVATLHGWTHLGGFNKMAIYTWLDSLSLSFLDGVVAVSQGTLGRKEVARRNLAFVRVIENGISADVSPPSQEDAIAKILIGLREKGPLIGSIGRLSGEKGFDILLHAFSLLKLKNQDAQLVLMGAGPCEASLREQALALGIESSVYFAGYVENAGKYLPLFSVFVNSSWTEGMPITLLEAMRARCLIVASNVGGIPELIHDVRGGYLCEPGNAEALANCLISAISSADADAVKQYSYERFIEKYSAKSMAKAYAAFYQDVLGGPVENMCR